MVSTVISYENTVKVIYTAATYQWQNLLDNNNVRRTIISLAILYAGLAWVMSFYYVDLFYFFYLTPYLDLIILTCGLLAIIMSCVMYGEKSAFLIFLIGIFIFLCSQYVLTIFIVLACCYVAYRIIETRRWKKIYMVLEKSPEQLAKIDGKSKKKKDAPRVEISFRGAGE